MAKIILDKKLDLDHVLAFATKKHEGQYRADGSPYIEHPIRVAKLVEKYKKSQNIDIIKAAAILHDVLEDTYTSYRELEDEFGEIIASLVMEVTSASFMSKLVGKKDYLASKMRFMSSYALIIKLADRLDNISDLNGLPIEKIEKTYNDTVYLMDSIENDRELTIPQKTLVDLNRKQLTKLKKLYNFE